MSSWIDNLIEAEWKLFRLLFLVTLMGDEIGKLVVLAVYHLVFSYVLTASTYDPLLSNAETLTLALESKIN